MSAITDRIVQVPDDPFSTVYSVEAVRRAVEPIELGLGGRVEWARYLDLPVGPGEKDPVTKNLPVTVLGVAIVVYGRKLKRARTDRK